MCFNLRVRIYPQAWKAVRKTFRRELAANRCSSATVVKPVVVPGSMPIPAWKGKQQEANSQELKFAETETGELDIGIAALDGDNIIEDTDEFKQINREVYFALTEKAESEWQER